MSHTTIRDVRYVVSQEMSPPFMAQKFSLSEFRRLQSADCSDITIHEGSVPSIADQSACVMQMSSRRFPEQCARAPPASAQSNYRPSIPQHTYRITVITLILRYTVKTGKMRFQTHLNDTRRVSSDLNSDFVSYWSY